MARRKPIARPRPAAGPRCRPAEPHRPGRPRRWRLRRPGPSGRRWSWPEPAPGQVHRRLGEPDAAYGGRVASCLAELRSARRCSTASTMPPGSRPGRGDPARHVQHGPADQGLHLGHERPRPSRVTVTQVPGTGWLAATGTARSDRAARSGRTRRGRSSRPRRWARTGFDRADDARAERAGRPRSADHVDHAPQCARALIDPSLVTWPIRMVASEHSWPRPSARPTTSPDLGHAAGPPSTPPAQIVCTESMTSRSGRTRLHVAEHRRRSVSGGQEQVAADRAHPVGAQPHLGRGLLARRRAAPCPAGHSAAASSSRVDLPTPASPPSSTTAPGTSPPPSTWSSSSMPVGRVLAAWASTSPMGIAGRAHRSGVPRPRPRPGTSTRDPGLLDRAHACTRRSDRPTWEPLAALRAAVARCRPLTSAMAGNYH